MRLIDADDLINELASFREKQEDPKDKDIVTTVSLFVEVYARTTTPIDVSVVRCKDCIHNQVATWNHGIRDNPRCNFTDYVRSNEFFCGFGEMEEK